MIKMVLKIFIRSRIELMFYLNVYEELKTSRFHNINFLEYKKKLEEEKKILKTGFFSYPIKYFFLSVNIIKKTVKNLMRNKKYFAYCFVY